MKKLALLFAAALFLAACHCERRTAAATCGKARCHCANGACQKPRANKKAKPAKRARANKKAQAARRAADKKAAALAAELGVLGSVSRKGTVININYAEPIVFAHNSDRLDASSAQTLDATADALKKYPDNKILVKGYTDSLGDPNYNIDLSQRRAQAVADALAKRGVALERLSAYGHGASDPVAPNNTPRGRAQNRRVTLQIVVE